MAKSIRGITVEIGGDTTKLGKAIEESEKKSRSLQVELRQIGNMLKFDPTNVELLTQKQTILTQNVAETSKKLDALKEAEKQVIDQFKRGEIAEDQMRALQREVIKCEGVLDSMKSELSSTETALKNLADGTDSAEKHTEKYKKSVEDAKNELDEFKEKASGAFDAVKTGATVLGGAVVATGGYALKLSTDFDQAFNTLISKTGASSEEMDSLNTIMESIYANNFGESIEDVAESLATVKQNTKLSGDELQNATERALLLRDTFEFEVNESTRSAKMLMDQYGMSAEDAFNLIAQGAQNGLDKNGDLLDTINEYAVHFSGLGLDAEEMFNMLSNGAESGTFSVDKLGDAVKEFGIRVKDGSDGTTEAFETLGLDVDNTTLKFAQGGEGAKEALAEVTTALFNMDDPLKQNQVGVALFGTMWEDLGTDGIKALMELDGGISTTKTALDDINATKYDDIGSALQGLGRTLETDVFVPLGEELKPVVEEVITYVQTNAPQIKEILSGIVSKIGEFVGFIVDNKDAILATIVGIGTGLLVWNVVSMITGVVNAIKAFKLANEGATIAQWALNVAMNANPIGIIIALIAGLVAGFAVLWNKSEGFRNFFTGLWEGIKNIVGGVVSAIGDFFSGLWEGIKGIFGGVGEWFGGVFSGAKDLAVGAWEGISGAFTTVKNGITGVFSNIGGWFKDKFTEGREKSKQAWANAKTIFSNVWTNVKGAFSNVGGWFKDKFTEGREKSKQAWSTAKQVFTGVWNNVKGAFSNTDSWFHTTFSGAWTKVKNVFSGWGSFFGGLWNTIKDKFSAIGTKISGAIGGAVKSGINGVISAIEGVINGAIGLINGAIGLINKIPGVELGKIPKVNFPRLAKGGIVDRSTFAEIGEDGREAVIPLEKNTKGIKEIAQKLNEYRPMENHSDGAILTTLEGIYDRLNRLQIVLDTGTLVGETIDKIDAGLANRQLLTARGV